MSFRPRSREARALGVAAVALAAAVSAGAAGGSGQRASQLPPLQTVIGNDMPAWSPDGTRIAFTSFRHGRGAIYVIGPAGRNERRLTHHPAHDDHAAWSPDGTRIAFVSNRNGNPEIYVMNADGTDQRRITRHPARDYYPSWSPDGTEIAFQSDRDGLPQIYIIGADGTGERRLTAGSATNSRPSWSSTGTIAFTSNREGALKIFAIQPDGSGLQRVFPSASHLTELEPAWSPDGSRIAFVSTRAPPLGNTEIYVAEPGSDTYTRLTRHPFRSVGPSWSPDGRLIAFTRGPSGFRPEVWVMNADGTGLRQLTSTAIRFDVVRIARTPQFPVAGRRFTLSALVSEPTGDRIERATATCRALLGTRVLPVAVRRFANSTVTCAWNIPARARAQNLRISFDVRSGRSGVARTLSLAVR
jgi:Tol biopolymer transport system component